VILSLGSWVYSEYLNNMYFQSYVNSLSPVLVPIVSVGFGLASATIATLLYFTVRNASRTEGLRDENLTRRKVPPKKMIWKTPVASPRSEEAAGDQEDHGSGPRTKLQTVGSYVPKRGTRVGGRDDEEESDSRTS
jgi:hypothetical protein